MFGWHRQNPAEQRRLMALNMARGLMYPIVPDHDLDVDTLLEMAARIEDYLEFGQQLENCCTEGGCVCRDGEVGEPGTVVYVERP